MISSFVFKFTKNRISVDNFKTNRPVVRYINSILQIRRIQNYSAENVDVSESFGEAYAPFKH